MTNRYQDFSYDYTYTQFIHKKHKIYNETTQTKQQKEHTHTV